MKFSFLINAGFFYTCLLYTSAQKGLQGAAEHHYPTMSIDELCALPVADLAAPDSALFLWATFPQLPEALRLIREWGFTYKSVAFVWLKKNRKADSWFYGLGFWTRANAEVCLLATRGHPKRQAANIHQFIISPIEAHSKKPDETRDKIVALMGDLPRVELFARQTPPGWDVWGLSLIHIYFFLDLMKKSLTFRLWQNRKKHFDFLRLTAGPL